MSLREVVLLGELSRTQCLRIVAAALEHASEHAIARALSAAVEGDEQAAASETVNLPGSGVEGVVDGRRYRLGRPQFAAELGGGALPEAALLERNGATTVALADESGWVALFVLGDTLRPDAAELVAGLSRRGTTVVLLSGEQEDAARQVARELGIQAVRAAMTPQGKLD